MKKFNKNIAKTILRGEIYYADLSPCVGSEQGGLRPVVIIQNDIGNKYAPTTIIAPLTSVETKHNIPTHVVLSPMESGLKCESVVLLEQVRTVDKCRLKDKVGQVASHKMPLIDKAIVVSLGIG